MDRNRWFIVLSVFCAMIVTLTLLQKFHGTHGETSGQSVSNSGTVAVSESGEPVVSSPQISNRRRQPTVPVELGPPPRFFLAVATPEEDGREMQELAERGRAVKPDAFTATGSARTGGPEGAK